MTMDGDYPGGVNAHSWLSTSGFGRPPVQSRAVRLAQQPPGSRHLDPDRRPETGARGPQCGHVRWLRAHCERRLLPGNHTVPAQQRSRVTEHRGLHVSDHGERTTGSGRGIPDDTALHDPHRTAALARVRRSAGCSCEQRANSVRIGSSRATCPGRRSWPTLMRTRRV